MANCQEYSDLSIIEQRILIGSCIHLMQNNSQAFTDISSMVRTAENDGLFEGVKIMPETERHYFTPSEKDKDFCGRCGKNFRDTNRHFVSGISTP